MSYPRNAFYQQEMTEGYGLVHCVGLALTFLDGFLPPVCVYCCFTLDAGLLARSQYPEGPATGHVDTGFSWFPCVYKRMLR